MGQTITEKIFSDHVGHAVHPDEIIKCNIDMVIGNDITTPISIKAFEESGATKLANPDGFSIVMDHYIPAKDIASANQAKISREFAYKHDLKNYFDEKEHSELKRILVNFENSKNKLTFNSNGNKLTHAIRLLIKNDIITGFNLTDASKWVVSNFLYLNKRQKNIIEFKLGTVEKTIIDGVECANPIIEIKNGKILKKDN